jgi:hypothetical protein
MNASHMLKLATDFNSSDPKDSMPQPSLPSTERARRKAFVEDLLRQGFVPQGQGGGISATKEAERRDKLNYPNWVRSEERLRRQGVENFAVDWAVFQVAGKPEEPRVSPAQHAQVRASWLSKQIQDLVTGSKYPLVNPEAIVIESHMVRRYDRSEGYHKLVESTPRTWLSDTLKVAGISDARGRKFIFSSAQNDAQLHPVFNNLKTYAAFLDAELVIGPLTYETQWWSENNPTSRAYAPELAEYLCFGQMEIGDKFIFAGEMNTLPTASAPISDLTTYSRSRWAVFPHQKRQLKSVPSTDPNVQAHQVMTTGSVTKPKVIPRKAGVKSIFHHVAGAVIVEFDQDGDVFCRQITADDKGTFYDLDIKVEDGMISNGHRVEAIVCGDLHLRKLDAANALATFGFDMAGRNYRNSILDVLKPKNILLHDVFDNESRNHHHANDNAYSYEMAYRGRDRVQDEINDVARFLRRLERPESEVIVVESNHDIGLDRWVREGRYRNDGINIRLGLQLEDVYMQYRESVGDALDYGQKAPKFSILEYAVRRIIGGDKPLPSVSWAYDGSSRLISGIEVGHHGFRGANGAKGTVSGFARVGRKMTIADKHSPEINEGVYVAGAINLQHGYNKGPSSWAVSHVLHYADGSRSIVTLQNGKWRAQRPRISVPAGTIAA